MTVSGWIRLDDDDIRVAIGLRLGAKLCDLDVAFSLTVAAH